MPKYTRKKYAPKRKTFRRRRPKYGARLKSRYNSSVAVVRNIVADRTLTRLKYTAGISLTSSGVAGSYVFRGNSIFDPDLTAGGSQPTGMDEWANFYSSYRVIGSSVKLVARSGQSDPATDFTLLCVQAGLDTITDSNYADMVGDPYTRSRMIAPTTAGYDSTLSHYMTTRKMFGLSKGQDKDADYQAAVTANPAKVWYWHLLSDDILSGAVDQNVKVFVTITYYVEFMNRKHLDRS